MANKGQWDRDLGGKWKVQRVSGNRTKVASRGQWGSNLGLQAEGPGSLWDRDLGAKWGSVKQGHMEGRKGVPRGFGGPRGAQSLCGPHTHVSGSLVCPRPSSAPRHRAPGSPDLRGGNREQGVPGGWNPQSPPWHHNPHRALTAAGADALHLDLTAELVVPVEDVAPEDGLLETELGVPLDEHPSLQDLCGGTGRGVSLGTGRSCSPVGTATPWEHPILGGDLPWGTSDLDRDPPPHATTHPRPELAAPNCRSTDPHPRAPRAGPSRAFPTCEVSHAELAQPRRPGGAGVTHHGQGVAVLEELRAADDAQALQLQPAHFILRDQHVPLHLLDVLGWGDTGEGPAGPSSFPPLGAFSRCAP